MLKLPMRIMARNAGEPRITTFASALAVFQAIVLKARVHRIS
jgi:hypothetical protein